MNRAVAVIGATGLQGGSVLRALHATGKYKLSALTRDTSNSSATKLKNEYPDVELVQANLNDIESLKHAFKGVDIVFGVTSYDQPDIQSCVAAGDYDAEFRQGKNVADAAIASGVKDIIFSTMYSISDLSNGKCKDAYQFDGKDKIEKYIRSKSSEIRSAFIQLGYYMENSLSLSRISPEDNATIEFAFPSKPTTKLAFVDVTNDTGAVVSYMLDNFDDFVGKTMPVSGGYYEAQELMNAFTEVTGKPARYVQVPSEGYTNEGIERMFKRYD
ncbi:hypothetical protein EV175_003403, partial [Coemansia sp. RSA 1933]